MSVFTTRSVTSSLEKIREDVLSQPPGAADFTLSDGTRLAFPINDIGAIVINRHVNGSVENPTFLPQNFSRASILAFANIAPGAIAYLAFGKYRSPEYRDATRTFPVDGTRVWQPRRQGMTDIYFSLFLPSGQKPPGGWPVVIYGAGSRGSILEAANYASINASRGLATISINGVGSGWGPLTTLTLTRISGTSTTFEWKGRGLDENGDGIILGGEGRVATHHDILGASDSNQQYIVDLMQFVRVVEAGLDWDGDGSADLNPSQILYEGHSYGATIGSMLVALEPAVKAAVFFSGNGANSWKAVGLIPGVRNVLGVAFASRMPSILTSPGISCLDHLPLSPSTTCIEGLPVPTTEPAVLWNENMPARDAAPLVLTVVGATAIQEWFDNRNWVRQPGEGGAYTVFLRKRPLPGRQPTPVIIGVARGDYAVPNPSAWDAVRAGELEDRVTFFRNDVAVALDSRMPKDPHRFSWLSDPESPTSSPLRAQTGRLIQTQAAVFLASLGTNTIDPDGTGPLFETPIPLPLPDGMHFIP
jgi:pimeloyl-ACP methyl ester carboxylesterase